MTREQKERWGIMSSALWGHLCAWRALLAGVSKSANEGGVAEEQVAGGSQETWEPWKVQASTPHPSPSALVQPHVSDNQGALTGTIHTLVTKKVIFAGNVPLAPPREGGCSLNPGVPWVREEPAWPKVEHTPCLLYPAVRPNNAAVRCNRREAGAWRVVKRSVSLRSWGRAFRGGQRKWGGGSSGL